MVSTRPLPSITMPEPSRSRPRFCTVRPSGLMKVLMRTTAETRSSTEVVCAGAGPWTSKPSIAPSSKISTGLRTRMHAPFAKGLWVIEFSYYIVRPPPACPFPPFIVCSPHEGTPMNERERPPDWQPELDELRERERLAKALGGPDKVRRQHDGGRLTV